MDTSPSALLRLFVPKVPFLAKTALWHSLWLSPTSSKWDLRTEMTVNMIRSLMDSPEPTPLLKQQRWSLKDPGIKGPMWISKVTVPPPKEQDVLDALVDAIQALKEADGIYAIPAVQPVEAEWTGYRANVRYDRPRLDLSEAQHYQRLMAEVASPVTILYFHGGAHYLMDPASHRIPTSRLANHINGRCLSVRYRLSPQNPFPCALLDAFLSYLSLLYPPPEAFHEPVAACNIVFAGDSAGGNICFALVQLILQINRSTTRKSLAFHDRTIGLPLPVPAGLSSFSPWMDISRCMPSVFSKPQYDYLPPSLGAEAAARFPHDEIWPTDPPRGDVYCDVSMLDHPLVSPLATNDWAGSCPMWFAYGEERLADEGKAVASLAAKQGVTVIWEQYEAMPHVFLLLLDYLRASKQGLGHWAAFCTEVAGGAISTKATTLATKGTCREEVRERMQSAKQARMEGKEGEAQMLPKL
ncbi:MAG: hypothetical protein L6R40_001827 [Gallowayella cf. fulva]|nr:MAG: hypothetical protein L6R40_001827 [Xanthomendoza cf. fulva]